MSNTHRPAFPETKKTKTGNVYTSGMKLRDYFAAKAMSALIIRTSMWPDNEDADLAIAAYAMADAMLAAREK